MVFVLPKLCFVPCIHNSTKCKFGELELSDLQQQVLRGETDVDRVVQTKMSIKTVDVAVRRTAEDLERSGVQFPLEFVARTASEVRVERWIDFSEFQI